MRVARGIAALSIASVAVLGLTACSSSDAPKSASNVDFDSDGVPTSDSSESTESTEDSSGDLTADNFVSRITSAAEKAGSVIGTMNSGTGADAATIETTLVWTDESPKMSMKVSSPGEDQVEIARIVDNIIYISGLDGSDKFIRIDPSDPSDPNAALAEGMLDTIGPNAVAGSIDGSITSFKKVGSPVDIDGVKAQQYEAVIDTSQISDTTKEDLGIDPSELPTKLTFQYWVDEDDLVRKMVFEDDGDKTTSTYTNWGEDLKIEAPSADQIASS